MEGFIFIALCVGVLAYAVFLALKNLSVKSIIFCLLGLIAGGGLVYMAAQVYTGNLSVESISVGPFTVSVSVILVILIIALFFRAFCWVAGIALALYLMYLVGGVFLGTFLGFLGEFPILGGVALLFLTACIMLWVKNKIRHLA